MKPFEIIIRSLTTFVASTVTVDVGHKTEEITETPRKFASIRVIRGKSSAWTICSNLPLLVEPLILFAPAHLMRA